MRFGNMKALTGLRGIAAVYVMMFHFFEGQPLSNPATSVLAHGYLAVDLFFILSGFVMALNYEGMFRYGSSGSAYLRFLGRRIARVYPLYTAMTLLACALMGLSLLNTPAIDSMPAALGLNLLMVQSWGLTASLDGPAWSISAEWAVYLLFPAILVPCLFRAAWLGWVSAAVCVMAVAMLCFLPAEWSVKPYPEMLLDLHHPAMLLPLLRCVPEFALGVLTFRASRTHLCARLARDQALSLAVCLAIVVALAIPKSDFLVVVLFVPLILSLTSGGHLPARFLASRPVEYLGELSYSIYLTHDLMSGLMGHVRHTVEGLGWQHGQSFAAVAGVALTGVASVVCYNVIERPGRSWLRQAFENRTSPSMGAEPSTP